MVIYMDHLKLKIEGGIAVLTLNRPDKKNALTEELLTALPAIVQEIENDNSVRVVILHGAGGDFCAGIDLTYLQSLLPKLDAIKKEMRSTPPNFFQRPAISLANLEIPVIAAIDGVCLGAGLQLALGADIRIAHPESRFAIMEAKWGLVADMGISMFLNKVMRADQAKELMMTARMINGDTAQPLGLVTRLADDPMTAALELAEELKLRSPQAVAASKALVDQTWPTQGAAGLEIEGQLQAGLIGSPNQMEAIMAGMMKREPKFD